MRYALFLGCTTPARQMNYEQSSRAVAEALGVEFIDLPFGCCGFPLEPLDRVRALAMAAQNLRIAAEEGLDIVALCSACAESLVKARWLLSREEGVLRRVNRVLKGELGVEYGGETPRVLHYARMLHEEVGLERIREAVERPLEGLRVAVHYGCHYMRPSEVYEGFEDPERPRSLDELVEATGAESVDYPGKMECCGGALLAMSERIAREMAAGKLRRLSDLGVDALILICPFCAIMYDRYQTLILEEGRVPVLYYPQLLGLALGLKPEELGFDLNAVSVEGLLEKVGAR
ncbi:MAG: putative CoB--CoM heterodisulfide reductase, subunit B [Candidatus Bathyarchaeota archaeon B23]|nr:MAG: putative CoB--CoM heterodisulfide reductase, subunit B [Candidatus Bathyarchaeota archaeon B23]